MEISSEQFKESEKAVTSLGEALRSEGIAVQGNVALKGAAPGAVHIVIGKRP